MLLESITLENFRQFRHESIDFAQGDNGKNVTIIIGENGTGKTTFAQAFFWCMYGETEFSDKNMLNKLVAAEDEPGQEKQSSSHSQAASRNCKLYAHAGADLP